jgi:hypothetical protein
MKRIDITQKFVATAEAKGYLDYLIAKQVFKRAIDAYAFAAAYAIEQNAEIPQTLSGRSNSLAEVFRLDEDVRFALEAGIHVIRKRNNQPEPQDSTEVFELVTKYAEIGLQILKQKWQGKTQVQIQDDIRKIIGE